MGKDDDRRLSRLTLMYGKPAPPAPSASSFDAERVDPFDHVALSSLIGFRDGEVDLDALSVEQLGRVEELTRKAHGLPPAPAYDYMPHRDPRIGPCRCADCKRRSVTR